MSSTLLHSVNQARPVLIEFYRTRARELRAEYYRDMWRAMLTRLTRIGRRPSIA